MTITLRILVGCGIAAAATIAAPLAANAAEPSGAVASMDSQIVVRDAASGTLRAATAEEAQALRASNGAVARRFAAPSPQAKAHHSGARGARLTDEFMSYSVLVRQADGTLAEYCFASREDADAAVKAGAAAPRSANLPTE